MEQPKSFELQINHIVTIAVIAIAILGYTTWNFYNISEQQKTKISQLQDEMSNVQTNLAETSDKLTDATAQTDSLTKEKETLTNQKRTAEQTAKNAKDDAEAAKNVAQYSTALALFMAQKADELDAILLEYDRLSTISIDWFITNGYFDNPSDADYVYSSWTTQISRLNYQYQAILQEIENLGE